MAVALDAKTTDVTPPSATPDGSSRVPVRAVAVVAILAPFLVAAIRIWSYRNRPFLPFADHALLEMQLRDLPAYVPLIGAYSRFGWHHPGPIEVYGLGIVYWLTGRASVSMWLGGLVINATACAVMVAVAFRRLGTLGGIVGTGVIAWYVMFLGPLGISDPWNPIIGVLPFAAFLLCLWDGWSGGRWIWLGAVAFGTFAMQVHLQFALPVTALGLGAIGALAWRRRHDIRRARACWVPVVAAAFGLILLAWLPPLIEQVRAPHGNLGAVARYVTDGRPQAHSWRESFDMAGRELVAPITAVGPGRWINTVYQWPPPARLALVAMASAVVWALARAILKRHTDLLGLAALGIVGWALAVVQFTRVERELWVYLCLWASAYFVPLTLFVAAEVLDAFRPQRARLAASLPARRRVRVGVTALAVLMFLASSVIALRPWAPASATRTVGPLAEQAAAQLPRNGPVLINEGGDLVRLHLMSLQGALLRSGIDVRASNDLGLYFGDRVIGDRRPVLTLELYAFEPQQPPPEIPGATLYLVAHGFALYQRS